MKRPVKKYANSEERHHHVTSQPFGGGGQKSNNDMMGVGEQEIETTDEDSVFCLTSSAPYRRLSQIEGSNTTNTCYRNSWR